ncbi:pectinesterase family protein [Tripterygium wilfordii]|uniref:Pectinesterase n=1 Tax=Tripterygium wilfordii TaxID=458696 RepID=A0A7J7D9W6_TRIWF|nr:putative pectinesterase/pectinesterase inhibitor 45 [Tripterygium wilfordii]KAF5743133.1 pectinesterase family protein [Tripterygium wilfordii]
MVFQDFDLLSERRRAERQRKFRKRIVIVVVSTLVLLLLVAAGVFAVVYNNKPNAGSDKAAPQTQKQQAPKEVSHVQKVIKVVCNGTSYKETCHSTLEKAATKNPSLAQPKEILKSVILAADDEVEKAFSKASAFKFDKPEEKAAFEDCKKLIDDAKEELKSSFAHADGDIKKLHTKAPELKNWLSAVMSYQQTCIDGFPEGKMKSDLQKAFKATKELTSNSLAMVSEFSSVLTSFLEGTTRHLLEDELSTPSIGSDGLPTWMSHDDRRVLKGANTEKPTPNVTVAKDGSGNFTTISAALAAMPAKYTGRYVIYVKQGVYDETVTVDKKKENVTMYGDGSQKTIVTGSKNFVDGVRTFQTATFVALGEGFLAKAMGFRNTAGPEKHQAVAVRVQADRSVFLNCRFEGYQDTLYAQTHRQFYKSCVISGTVDFIFGDAAAIFQNCLIIVRKPLDNQQNIVTAQGRIDKFESTGIVLQNCKIQADNALVPAKTTIKSYLGRPWKEYSRTIIMESTIDDLIHPDGFLPWEGDFALKTLYYAEFNNKGPGAKTTARVKWPGYKVINRQEALEYTVGPFLQGDWVSATGAPVKLGLFT